MSKLMLIHMAMRVAIQGMKEGIQNLVQYLDNANQTVSGLMINMICLRNSFAATFAPTLPIVAPVLNTLVNLLTTAVRCISQFSSVLDGGSTSIQVKRASEDYVASFKRTGGAAGAAGKGARRAPAPPDDLAQIQQ